MNASFSDASAGRYQRALASYRSGDYQLCGTIVDEQLADEPQNEAFLILKGMSLLELGETGNAIETLRTATQIAPTNAEAWSRLGVALMTEGQLAQAGEALRTALRLKPDDARVRIDLGNLLFLLDRREEAFQTLEDAHRLRPEDVTILRNLADMYATADLREAALRTTRQILQQRSDDALARCDAAWLCLQLGRLDEAAEMFRSLRRDDSEQGLELFAIHALVMIEIRRRDWRRALLQAIEATRLDRYDFTTALLSHIGSKVFDQPGEVTEEELDERFEHEYRELRRLLAEGSVSATQLPTGNQSVSSQT